MARIISQNRGRGGPNYRCPKNGIKPIKYHLDVTKDKEILEILHEPGRTAPLAKVKFNNIIDFILCAKGVYTSQIIKESELIPGNVMYLKDIPLNTMICNLELSLGDGGKLLRTPGTSGIITEQSDKMCTIKIKNKYIKISSSGRATIGSLAGDNKLFKPLLKASHSIFKAKNKARKGYSVSRVAMNHQDHPFGSSGPKHSKKPRQCARGDSPGSKVGSIAPRRQGHKR